MKKRIFTAALSCMLFVTGNVCAFTADTGCVGNKVTVECEVEPLTFVTMIVTEKGGNISDNKIITAAGESKSDENGKAVFVFDVPSATIEKAYTVYLKETGGTEKVFDFYYASEGRVTEITGEISDADSVELINILDNAENATAIEAIGINHSIWLGLTESEKEKAAELFEEEKKENIVYTLNLIICAVSINAGHDVEKNLDESGIVYENTRYDDITDEKLRVYIAEYIAENGDYDNASELMDAYGKACALYTVSNTRYDKLSDILGKYSDILELDSYGDYKKYKGLSKKSETDVNEKLYNSFVKKGMCESTDDLKNRLSDAVSEIKTSSGGSSGGGGGGGSASSAVSSAVISAIKNPEEENNDGENFGFTDIDSVPWAYDAIEMLASKGIINGDGEGNFMPDKYITREETAKILVTLLDAMDEEAKCPFGDVPVNAWYYHFVASAYKGGIVKGISETEFGSGKYITRQDFAVMAYRSVGYELLPVRDSLGIADRDDIDKYAFEAVEALYNSEMINGDENGCFNPHNNTTRAEAAQMLYNIFMKGDAQ